MLAPFPLLALPLTAAPTPNVVPFTPTCTPETTKTAAIPAVNMNITRGEWTGKMEKIRQLILCALAVSTDRGQVQKEAGDGCSSGDSRSNKRIWKTRRTGWTMCLRRGGDEEDEQGKEGRGRRKKYQDDGNGAAPFD